MESIFERVIVQAFIVMVLILLLLIISFIWRKSKISIFAFWKMPPFRWWIILLIPYLLISKTVISICCISARYSSIDGLPLYYDQEYIISNPSIDDYLYMPLLCVYMIPLVYFFVKNKESLYLKIKEEKVKLENIEIEKTKEAIQEVEFQKFSDNENQKLKEFIEKVENKKIKK
jgi:hypothetical protein